MDQGKKVMREDHVDVCTEVNLSNRFEPREIMKKHAPAVKNRITGDSRLTNDKNYVEDPTKEELIDDVRNVLMIACLILKMNNFIFSNEKEQGNITDAEFISTTRLNGRDEFDAIIKLWIKHVPDWKIIFTNDLVHKKVIVERDLIIVGLKVIMNGIMPKHPCGLTLLMIKCKREEICELNLENYAKGTYSACKVAIV